MQKSPEQRLAVFEKNTEEGLGTKLMFIRPPYCLNKSYQHSIETLASQLVAIVFWLGV